MPEIMSSYTNDEGEHATVERVTEGPFTGRLILVIHNDYPSIVQAPMLLDEGTIGWLRRQFGGDAPTIGDAGAHDATTAQAGP